MPKAKTPNEKETEETEVADTFEATQEIPTKDLKKQIKSPTVKRSTVERPVLTSSDKTDEINIGETQEVSVVNSKQSIKDVKPLIASTLKMAEDETVEISIVKKNEGHSLVKQNKKNQKNNIPVEVTRYSPFPEDGLSTTQVEERIAHNLINKIDNTLTKSYWNIFSSNIFTFFNLILIGLGVALICVGSFTDIFFLVIMVVNTTIGIFQEIKAKKTIEKLRLVTAPSAMVIRNGVIIEVPVDNICLDDIIEFKSGKQISVDCIVKSGSVEVNESLLTGEALPIKKNDGDVIFAGSFVVSGICRAQVDKIGRDCYAITLQEKARKFRKPKSELLRSLNTIITVISFIIVPVGILMVFNNLNTAQALFPDDVYAIAKHVVEKTAGSIIGMIPAGMFLLTSVTLAVGVIRLAKRKTAVQDLYGIEMLARVNVLCLDKTGTLTDGTMVVDEVVMLKGGLSHDIGLTMGSYLASFDDNNQTSIALGNKFPINHNLQRCETIPFSSSRKYSAVSFDAMGTYILGAPEYVYKGKDKGLWNLVEEKTSKGYRLVMLAFTDKFIKDGKLSGVVTPVALFVIKDHIRDEAPATIKWFNENGVDVKIISGDNPLTASEIARSCGVKNAEKFVSLEGLSESEVAEIANEYAVFGRVSPEQKATLIKALKNMQNTVAMTGDGVNDILAMKQADCSIAMASGAESARNVSHLVLMDSNFASLPCIVEEGRRVINNIQRTSVLFLMKTFFTMALSIFTIITMLFGSPVSYPFSPKNLMIWECFAIGIPSFFLAIEPNKKRINGHFMKNVITRAIPGSISFLFAVGLVYFCSTFEAFGFSNTVGNNQVLVCAIISMTSVGFVILLKLCEPLNPYRLVLFISMLAGFLLSIFVIPSNFTDIDWRILDLTHWLLIVIVILATFPIFEVLSRGFAKLREGSEKSEEEARIAANTPTPKDEDSKDKKERTLKK